MKNLTLVETVTVNDQVIEFRSNGSEIYTDSLTVARVFEKRHDSVLRTIEAELSLHKNAESIESGFIASTYQARNLKQEKFYFLSKEAFTDLIMNFTGAKAKAWKKEYRIAFNRVVESHRGLTKELTRLQTDKELLLEENLRLKNIAENAHRSLPLIRKESDNMRRDNFTYISEFFTASGKGKAEFKTFQMRMYEDIYLVVTGTVARNIVLSRFEDGIQSYHSTHKTPHLSDYTIAFNFLKKPEMVLFMSIYDELCRDAVIAIDENQLLTPDILIETVDMKLKARIKERRGYNKGDSISRPDKVMADNLVEKTVKGYFPICDFKTRRASLKSGRAYRL